MTERLRLDLPLLLPEVPDARDRCVARLEAILSETPGVVRTHIVHADDPDTAALCLHYDPSLLTLDEVSRIAETAGASLTARFGHAVLAMRVVRGEDVARRIERDLREIDGVLSASVNMAAQRARVEFDRETVSLDRIRAEFLRMGYSSASPGEESSGLSEQVSSDQGKASWYARNKELVWSLIAGALLLVAWLGEQWLELGESTAIILYLGAYGFGAFDLVRHWVNDLRKGRVTFDIELLMLLAALGAAALGEWAEGAFLLFLFSLAHALEHYALGRARRAIRALAELAPPRALVLRDGKEVEVGVEEIAPGETVVVRPAERIPVDGEVRTGRSSVNQAPITGESIPAEKTIGDEVFAGTVNGEGALEVITTRAVGDRTLDRVVQLVEEAQTEKAPTQRFTERFERIFVPSVLVADALLITIPPLFGLWDLSTSFYRGMALLVAASPCALALGTPSAVLAGIAQAARKGVLIKGGAHLENLGTLRAFAFDKTGTLTIGKPEVTDLIPAEGVDEVELLSVAAAVEKRSQHPLAQAVARRAQVDQLALPVAGEVESLTARGVRSTVAGTTVEIGSLRLWDETRVEVPGKIREAVELLQAQGRSTLAVRHGDRWLGVLGVSDRPREGARTVLEELRNMGIAPLVMLTGDNRGVGNSVGGSVGIDEVRAELLPEDKVDAIRALLADHGQVAMVGDGVNDAPALAHATVGIAMGGAGTAVALETADVALMADDLGNLPFAVGLSRQAKTIIRQNLYISLGVIVLLIAMTISGTFGIGVAVLFHEGSTLVVIANALRLLAYENTK